MKARGQRDEVTLVGHTAAITAGEFIQATGTWVNDRTHGRQFRAAFLRATPPTSIEGIEKYLGSGMLPVRRAGRGAAGMPSRRQARPAGEVASTPSCGVCVGAGRV